MKLEIINKLAKSGLGIIMTSHFPDHAFLCSSKVALLQRNHRFIVGEVEEVITEENLRSAYRVDVKIVSETCEDGQVIKSCVPLLFK